MPLDNALPLLPRLRDRLRDYRPSPDRIDAAVLIPVTDAPVPELILTRRASHMTSHAGEVAFPGGKCDPEDTSIIATALRESREEIGLAEHSVEIIGELDAFTSRLGLRVQPIVGMVPDDAPLVLNPDEIESVFRVPLAFFLTEAPAYTHRVRFMGQDITVPSFNFSDYVIWGLTAAMIVDLVHRVYDHQIDFRWPALFVPSTDQGSAA
ncbi:MAG: mismatch repair protein MutT [Moraxellaceae bacterium]|nr:mismatch repair protein MutT [Moraxellaceae bacterium]